MWPLLPLLTKVEKIFLFLQEIRFIKKIGNYDEGNLIIENDKIAKPPGGCWWWNQTTSPSISHYQL